MLAAVAASVCVASLLALGLLRGDAHRWSGSTLPRGSGAPALDGLHDITGSPLDLADGITLLYFGYTDCVDVCPVVLSTAASAVRVVDAEPGGDGVVVAMVSVDVEADPLRRLADYVTAFDPRFVALGGSQEAVDVAATLYGVFHHELERAELRRPLIDHTSTLVAIVDGDIRVVWGPEVTPADMANDLAQLL